MQRYFEQEHGVQPIPVVHAGTPIAYLERYLNVGKYDLIGIGGFSAAISSADYVRWADSIFTLLCPAVNGYLPVVRTHGFAMTSWKILCRYPWWSVDSATWVKLSAYGWLYVPRWNRNGWRYDRPPMQINISWRSPFVKLEDRHFDNVSDAVKELILRWLKYCDVKEGSVDGDGNEVEFGARSHFRARSRCNLIYFKGLEESRPKWPYPLDTEIIRAHAVEHRRGFGI